MWPTHIIYYSIFNFSRSPSVFFIMVRDFIIIFTMIIILKWSLSTLNMRSRFSQWPGRSSDVLFSPLCKLFIIVRVVRSGWLLPTEFLVPWRVSDESLIIPPTETDRKMIITSYDVFIIITMHYFKRVQRKHNIYTVDHEKNFLLEFLTFPFISDRV